MTPISPHTRPAPDSRPRMLQAAGIWSLLFASLTAIIGSGWLFAPLNAARQAGPASVFSWLIGAVAVLLLAFVNAELSTAFPRMGAAISFPKLSHGDLLAVVMSWMVLLGYAGVGPSEVLAVVTYANNYIPGLVHSHSHLLEPLGFAVSVVLLGGFVLINALGVKLMLRVGNTVMIWKLLVPALTAIALLSMAFHGANFHAQGFAPMGVQGMVGAVAGSGIVFSFLGFRQAIELSGEARRPQRDLPIAIVGSVLFAALLFIVLELAFVGAVRPADLAAGGWSKLRFAGSAGPFAGLAMLAGMSWLAALLYVDAVVSPAGTSLTYMGTTARVIYASGREGLGFSWLGTLNSRGVPRAGLWVTWVAGVLFFLPFPSWQKIVSFLSSAMVLGYGAGPVALMTLRRTLPISQYKRPFTLRGAGLWAPLAFIISNFIIYWSGRRIDDFLFGALALMFLVYAATKAAQGLLADLDWAGAWWLLPYFLGMWAITHFGPHDAVIHGVGLYGFYTGMGMVALLSLVVLWLAVLSGLPDPMEARYAMRSREMAIEVESAHRI